MLKLTARHTNHAIYFRTSSITAIEDQDFGPGSMVWTSRTSFEVNETTEQIMAMPEMQREFNPLASIPPSGAEMRLLTETELLRNTR